MRLKGEKITQFWHCEDFCSLVSFLYKTDCSQINAQHVGLVSFKSRVIYSFALSIQNPPKG